MASSSKKIMASMNGNYTHIFCNYKIYKNFPKKGVLTFSSYQGGKFLRVTQTNGLKWKIEGEKDTILLGYNCQMARTSFAGRNYIAWFTPRIPINDGPYKFQGLPGLIVKISDTKNEHRFTLTGIQKLKYIQPILYNQSKYLDINAEEFVKAMKANLASLFGKVQNGDITISSDEGKAKSLQGLKTRNNFIEKY
jgi:GLPGLI family protein